MPTLAVPRAVEPARLLALHPTLHRPVVLDGAGPDSWGNGGALLVAEPRATLAVYADGRARIVMNAMEGSAPALPGEAAPSNRTQWVKGEPFKLWGQFLSETPALLGSAGDREAAGFVTVLSYDLKHWVESLPRRHRWPSYPVLYCAFHDWTYRYDYTTWSAVLHAQTAAQIERIIISVLTDQTAQHPASLSMWQRLRPQMDRQRYRERLAAVHRYIAAGDVYQVNFAQPFSAAASPRGAPMLFARMQHAFPMPFAAYVDAGDVVAVSNSPECFLIVDGDRVSTFPIKGTRALGSAMPDLRGDAKEWAEHVMIVDLERNDLGRVCRTGSVEVVDFGAVRAYPLLAHMVSAICGRLRPNITLPELITATFPGGSITGAPKIRAMQIIEELEIGPRGLYTGAIGWTDLSGHSRFNLAIRTAVFADDLVTYHAGGGIVADSDAEREYDETLLKAEAIFRTMASM